MRKLENLLPFLVIFIFIVIVLMQMTSNATVLPNQTLVSKGQLVIGQKITVSPICAFKIKTAKKSRLARLVPYGVYRLVGQKYGEHYRNAFFQRQVGDGWKTLGETRIGPQFSVSVRNSRDSLLMYLRESSGNCALEGSLHGWGA